MEKLEDRLALIASIKPGMTISTSTMTLMYRRSWYSATSRYLNADSREKTLTWMETIIHLGILEFFRSPNLAFRSLLMETRPGIQALAETYSSDVNIDIRCRNLIYEIGLAFKTIVSPDDRTRLLSPAPLPEPLPPTYSDVLALRCPSPSPLGWSSSEDLDLEPISLGMVTSHP